MGLFHGEIRDLALLRSEPTDTACMTLAQWYPVPNTPECNRGMFYSAVRRP
jgi:hypothetical protein